MKMAPSCTIPLIISTFLSLSITQIPLSNADFLQSTTPMWRMDKTTHLYFFFQDRLSGRNPTAVQIIGKGIGFGTTFIIDDALTEGQNRNSKIIGRAQGMYSIAAQNDIAFLMVVTFSFSEGKYNGSSISMIGRNHVMDDVREMPIVGGSGLFRFGRGYALVHTVWFDPKTGDASVEYNVTVNHF